ncbi:MAG: SDR family oxidoreductase [Ignavibacteriales bacterium]|nr:MAG: SDR family oxidoreductase [Ignavibacteriales bacterium]
MELGLKDKVALVTASSKGIGRAVAEGLIEEGCKVAICSRSKDDLESASSEIKRKTNYEPFWCVCDLSKPKDIESTFTTVHQHYGKIDILVNNCGGPVTGFLKELDEQNWLEAFDQVLMSTIRFSKLVLPEMISHEWGRIINITSISVKQPIENLMLSNTYRSGIIGFTKSLSNESAKYGITVNSVAPGHTLTRRAYELAVSKAKLTGMSHEEVLADMAKQIPMNRLAAPEEIASLVTFLASTKAGYITGTTIHVDGGFVKSVM